jgi:hypothetical protein
VEDSLAAGGAIEHVVDDAGEIDAKSRGHGVGLAGKTRWLAISEPRSFLPEMAYDPRCRKQGHRRRGETLPLQCQPRPLAAIVIRPPRVARLRVDGPRPGHSSVARVAAGTCPWVHQRSMVASGPGGVCGAMARCRLAGTSQA